MVQGCGRSAHVRVESGLGRGETALVPVPPPQPPPPPLPGRLALASLLLLLRLRRWKAAIKPIGKCSCPQILFQVHLFNILVTGSELVQEQSKQIWKTAKVIDFFVYFSLYFFKKTILRAANPPRTVQCMHSAIKEWALVLYRHYPKAKCMPQVMKNMK